MKFSISVPDQLWESAGTVIAGDSPSAVVQEALRRVSSGHTSERSYAEPPAIEDELAAAVAATRERLLKEVRGLYQAGFRQGLELAGRLDWRQLSQIVARGVVADAQSNARQEWDTLNGGGPVDVSPTAQPCSDYSRLLATYVGSHADFTGGALTGGHEWTPDPVTVEGMDRAMRDMWEQVRSHPPAAASAPPPGNGTTTGSTS